MRGGLSGSEVPNWLSALWNSDLEWVAAPGGATDGARMFPDLIT